MNSYLPRPCRAQHSTELSLREKYFDQEIRRRQRAISRAAIQPADDGQPSKALCEFYAHMGLAMKIARVLEKYPGGLWRNHEVLCLVEHQLGTNFRISCARWVCLNLVQTIALREGLPWPTMDDLVNAKIRADGLL